MSKHTEISPTCSMTAFARNDHNNGNSLFSWEIRSVNHRYLELQIKLPEAFRGLEPILRDKVKQVAQRGKIDLHLRHEACAAPQQGLQLSSEQVTNLATTLKQLQSQIPSLQPANALDVLTWPGIVQQDKQINEQTEQAALEGFDTLLEQFQAHRQREGEALKGFLLQHIAAMSPCIEAVQAQAPIALQQIRQKMQLRFAEINQTPNNERLEQEMVYWAQKLDHTEEIERLQAHLTEVDKALNQGSPTGRRLDFLMQELNRECNTLGAKSYDSQLTAQVVELKVLVEKMREQVQNIE